MSVVFVSFIDPLGKKGSFRIWIADDEDEIDYLDRIKSYLLSYQRNGYHILRVEVT